MKRPGEVVNEQAQAKDARSRINTALDAYYTHYYRDELGLPDWRERVDSRLQEETTFGEPKVMQVEGWLN